jgi:outer membrane receptor for ferrienterochelin and colicin
MKEGDSRVRIVLLIALVVIALVPVYSSADIEPKSSIIGTLIGPSQKPASGVTVRLLDSYFLNEVAKIPTDREGKFVFGNLFPGLYLVTVDLPALAGIFKRVQVLSDAPTFIDLRSMMSEEDLKDHDAWDKFKWTIRVAGRNPLRDDFSGTDDGNEDGFLAALKSFRDDNKIRGEVSYVSLAPNQTTTNWSHQMTQIAVKGEMDGSGTWSFNGNILDGTTNNYTANGDFEYSIHGHQIGTTVAANDLLLVRNTELMNRQLVRRFVQSTGLVDSEDESRQWVASADLRDHWMPAQKIELDYGTRIDYYGYLNQPMGYSPHVKATYRLTPQFGMEASYYHNQSAPGNYYLQSGNVNPYIHNVAFIPYSDVLTPETTVGYQAGIALDSPSIHMEVLYHQENVQNKMASIDISQSRVSEGFDANRSFVILNSTDLAARGVELHFTKKITPVLTAVASYRMDLSVPVSIVEKNTYYARKLYFMQGDSVEDFHDLQAGILANIPQTQTEVSADWKWSSGTPIIFGPGDHNSPLSAVDVEVHQSIPVQVFSQTELQILVAIKNLLDQNPQMNGNADFQRALVYNVPRVVAGGLLLKF